MISHESLPLLPLPGVAPTQPRSVPRTMPVQPREQIRRGNWVEVENAFRLRDERDRRSNPIGGKDAVPANTGGESLTATVVASISPTRDGDTRVPHNLGRVPQAIVLVESTGIRPGDRLEGRPEGGLGLRGGNATPWDNRFVYVRSNVATPGRVFTFVCT